MLTVNKVGGANNRKHAELRGLASDLNVLNPNDIPNGSTFLEIDTSNTYMYDAENQKWYLQKSSGGGYSGLPIYLWTSGSRYNVNDLVIKDGLMYICIVANSDTEWDSNHWSAIGSSDGNYGVVSTIGNLPSGLSTSDRKIYFVEAEKDFYLWDGTNWNALNSSTEPISIEEINNLFD